MKQFYFALAATLLLSACKQNQVVKPTHKSLIEAVYASGFVVPKNEYKLYAISDGYIVKKLKEDGDEVKAGEALYQIQNESQSARFEAAENAYRIALQNLQSSSPVLQELQTAIENALLKYRNDSIAFVRVSNMFEHGAVTRNEFDKAQLALNVSKNEWLSTQERMRKTKDQLTIELKNAQSNLQSSGNDLNNYTLRSIIDGLVYETYKEQGELVRRNDMVALIGDKNEKIIQLAVDQQDIEKVKVGQKVLVKMDISGNKIYEARVEKVYPAMNQNEQSFRVDAIFEKGFEVNFIKTSVEANIVVSQRESTIVIPRKALIGENKVRLKNGQEVEVKTGIGNLEEVEILSGISDNDELQIPDAK